MTPLSDAITTALLHSLWQEALIAAVLAALLAVLRHRSPNARYLTCCAALALMAAVPLATTAATMARSLAATAASGATEVLPVAPAGTTASAVSFGNGLQLVQPEWVWAIRAWALPLWIAGVLLLSLRLAVAGGHAMVVKRRGQPADDALVASVHRLAHRMGISRRIGVVVAPLHDGPATIGWLRPVILLPPATAMGITPRQLEGLLAHELAHIRRHDYLVNLSQMVVETLYFYHPAVWWVSRRIRLERELCCDDLAVLACGDPVGYARALTTLARLRMMTPTIAMAARGGPLVTRIRRLVSVADEPRSAARWPAVLMLLLVISTGTICAGWLGPQTAGTPVAQGRGTIYGYVYDPFGEPAAGITMTLDNNVIEQDTGPLGSLLILDVTTDALGYYRFDNVPAGAYVLTPTVAWARATAVVVPPSGSVQHDVWIAFDTMHTALFVNARQPPRSPQPSAESDDTAAQNIVGPRYVGRRMFQYPEGLRLSGDVVMEGHIGTDGLPKGLRVVSAMEPELARAALAVAQQGRWEPARVRGIPLEMPVRVTVVYRLTLN